MSKAIGCILGFHKYDEWRPLSRRATFLVAPSIDILIRTCLTCDKEVSKYQPRKETH